MQIQFIAKPAQGLTGTSRYGNGLCANLRAAGEQVNVVIPRPLPKVLADGFKRIGLDVSAFLNSYPYSVPLQKADVYHINTQTMATLLWFQRFPAPVVVTVLDIIPYLVRSDPQLNTLRHPADALLYRIALAGLRRAAALIAISGYTKQSLIDTLGLSADKIHVIYPSVDFTHFRPLDVPSGFYDRYNLDPNHRYVMYVGSEDPRKNLQTFIRALAQVPNVSLLKVGKAHHDEERARLLQLVSETGVRAHFINEVSDDDLPWFYNMASVLVLPSLYEGFGYPIVEAMACGTPVVAAKATSLPELVGEQGAIVDPLDPQSIGAGIEAQLNDMDDRAVRRQRYAAQLQKFSAEETVRQVLSVYTSVSSVGNLNG